MLTVLLALPTEHAALEDRLAGLSLVARAVLSLQALGAETIVVVLRDGDERILADLQRDRRVRVRLEALAWCGDGHATLRALRDRISDQRVLVVRHDVVADPAIARALLASPKGPRGAVVQTGRQLARVAGPLLVTSALLDALLERELGIEHLAPAHLAREENVRILVVTACFLCALDSKEAHRRATYELFEACRKPIDGIVSRTINRHISIFISKRLVDTPITPNMMSVLTLLLGVAACASVSRGGYAPMLLGAFLLQWNSILDGVDGELARVRFQHSRLGQWLDTISDDATNILFWSALAIGVRTLPHGAWLSACGWTAAGANLLFSAIYYVELVALGSGDVLEIEWEMRKSPPTGLMGRLLVALSYLPRKDLFIFGCLVCALIGLLPFVLPVIAAGAVISLVANVGRVTRRALRRPLEDRRVAPRVALGVVERPQA